MSPFQEELTSVSCSGKLMWIQKTFLLPIFKPDLTFMSLYFCYMRVQLIRDLRGLLKLGAICARYMGPSVPKYVGLTVPRCVGPSVPRIYRFARFLYNNVFYDYRDLLCPGLCFWVSIGSCVLFWHSSALWFRVYLFSLQGLWPFVR